MKAKGLKEVRLWVLDLDAPGAREELAAEVVRINESDARNPWIWKFLEQCGADMEAETPPYPLQPECIGRVQADELAAIDQRLALVLGLG